MVQDRDAALRVHRHAEHLAQIHVGRILQEVRGGIERNFGRRHDARRLRQPAGPAHATWVPDRAIATAAATAAHETIQRFTRDLPVGLTDAQNARD